MVDYRRVHNRLSRVFDKDVYFITGLTRAGTTWLRHAMDAHPEACCRGEAHLTDVLLPLLGRAFGRYNQHSSKLGAMRQSTGPETPPVTYAKGDVAFIMATAIGLILTRCADDDRIRCVGEATPEHVVALDLLKNVVPDARFIHVVRDGRDEAASAWDFNMAANRDGFSQKFSDFDAFVNVFAQNWNRSVGAGHAFGRGNREAYLEVCCEDLYDQPWSVVDKVCRFLAVSNDSDTIEHCIEAGRAQAMADGVPGYGRDRFEGRAMIIFRRHAGELLKLLEYDT